MTDQSHGDQEALVDFAKRVEQSKDERSILILKLSGLDMSANTKTRVLIAHNLLDAFNNGVGGNLFFLGGGDTVLSIKDVDLEQLHAIIEKIARTFNDSLSEMDVLPNYIQVLNLPNQAGKFVEAAETMRDKANVRKKQMLLMSGIGQEVDGEPTDLFHTSDLQTLEKSLANTDISSVLREQPIFYIDGDDSRITFTEFYVALDILADAVMPGVNIATDMMLMRKLTLTLDERILSWLAKEPPNIAGRAFSINLNLKTVSSKEFMETAQAVWSLNHQTIIIELHLMDIIQNIDDYHAILPFMRERGYKVSVDGIRCCDMQLINIPAIDADYYKVQWRPEVAEDKNIALLSTFAAEVNPARIIMCHCDSKDAISTGFPLKIRCYQGRFLDETNRAEQAGYVTLREDGSSAVDEYKTAAKQSTSEKHGRKVKINRATGT